MLVSLPLSYESYYTYDSIVIQTFVVNYRHLHSSCIKVSHLLTGLKPIRGKAVVVDLVSILCASVT